MTARLLCIGDIHLGRRPSRIPDLASEGVSPADLTPAAAWARAVELAIELRVAAVVLAGDVVESDNRFFEAYGPLHTGVTRLAKHGIPVVGVAGNHDVQVLPKLAKEVPEFKLLGAGGRWEQHVISVDGVPALRLLGWSFPEKIVRRSPFDTLPVVDADLPTIGVLHCDLDAQGSEYAPVTSAALQRAPGVAWLLGHIHKPTVAPGPSPRGYLGNLASLDPGELGQRGAWLLELDGSGTAQMTRLPISPVRWERVDVDVSELAHPDDLPGAITRAVQALDRMMGDTLGEARVVGCRVRLVGAASDHRGIVRALAASDPRRLRHRRDRCLFFVESAVDESRQALDLDALARGTDPPALLAGMLLDVERGTDAGRAIVQRVASDLARVGSSTSFAGLPAVTDVYAHARAQVARSGLLALEELLAQKENR